MTLAPQARIWQILPVEIGNLLQRLHEEPATALADVAEKLSCVSEVCSSLILRQTSIKSQQSLRRYAKVITGDNELVD